MLVEFLNLNGKHEYKEIENSKIEEVKSHGEEGFLIKDDKYYRFDHIVDDALAVFKEVDFFTIKVAMAKFRLKKAKTYIEKSKTLTAQSLDPNEVRRNALNTFQVDLTKLDGVLEQYKTSYDPKNWKEFKQMAISAYKDIKSKAEMLKLEDIDLNSIYHYFNVIHKDSQGKNLEMIKRDLNKMQPLIKKTMGEVTKQLALLPEVPKQKIEAPQSGIPSGVPRHHAPRPSKNSIEHIVTKGESLSGIAKKYPQYKIDWKDIYVLNSDGRGAKLTDPNKISIGDKLTIPTGPLEQTFPDLAGEKGSTLVKPVQQTQKKEEQQKQPVQPVTDETEKDQQPPTPDQTKKDEEPVQPSKSSLKDSLDAAANEYAIKGYISDESHESILQHVNTAMRSGKLSDFWNVLNQINQEEEGLVSQIKEYPFPDLSAVATAYGKGKQYNAKDWEVLPYIERFYGQVDKKGNALKNSLRTLVKRYAPDLSKLQGAGSEILNQQTEKQKTLSQEYQDAINESLGG